MAEIMKYSENEELLNNYFKTKDIQIRNQIAELNICLVYNVAHQLEPCCTLPFEDLVQIGSLGLIKAIERFDPTKKRKLSTLAMPFIKGAILQFLRDKSRIVRAPRTLQETHQKIKACAKQYGISYEQAAHKLGVSAEVAKEADIICNQIALELPDSLSGSGDLIESSILPLLDKLPELHASVLRCFYIENLSYKQISTRLEISVHKIKIIESEALACLKNIVAGKVRCPACFRYGAIKYGKREGKQAYLCKSCGTQFTQNQNISHAGIVGYSAEIKNQVLSAIAQGKSLRWCEKYFGVSKSIAHVWVQEHIIDKSISYRKNTMTPVQQWQIVSKFSDLSNFLIKSCPDSPHLESALNLLSQAMQKSCQAAEKK